MKQRRKPHAVKAQIDERIERFAQRQVLRRYRDARGDLHLPLLLEERSHALDDSCEAARSPLERTQSIMDIAEPVQTDRNREAMPFEKITVHRL
jgi:hypothetical protein